MRFFTALSCLSTVLLAGCSLFNAPDRDLITQDGGTSDMRIADAGPDSDVPTDVFDAGPELVELCDQVGDEDLDELSDCADPDCAGDTRCCTGGEVTNIGFEDGSPTWRSIGNPVVNGTQIVFPSPTPSVYVNNLCYPLARGAVFEFDVIQNTGIDCIGGVCPDFAAMYLSSVRTAAEASRIVAEIGVTVRASGQIELYRGRDNVIETMEFPLPPNGVALRVSIRVTPDTADGEAVLRAVVTVGEGEGARAFVARPMVSQGDLIDGCRDGISGLYYGVEGQGRRVFLDSAAAVATTLECTNPTQFTSSECLPVTANGEAPLVSLGWPSEWSGGDVAHPELVRDGDDWHVYGSTSVQQLEFSTLPDFPWSMAASSTVDWNEDSLWFLEESATGGREPTVALGPAGIEFVRFGVIGNQIHRCEETCEAFPIECEGLANPSLVLAEESNYLLFYQCGFGAEQTVHVRPLTPGKTISDAHPSSVVLRASDFGSLARNGFVDLDVLFDVRGDGENREYLIRAWFVAEALGNVRTLVLATGTMKLPAEGVDTAGELDVLGMGVSLVPYPANPIATERILFRDPNQSLQGVSVEHNGSPRDLLFLFGRRTERPEGRLYDFVPIEQTWGNL